MKIDRDDWLSEVLDYDVFRVDIARNEMGQSRVLSAFNLRVGEVVRLRSLKSYDFSYSQIKA